MKVYLEESILLDNEKFLQSLLFEITGFATYVENIGKDIYDPDLQSRDRVILFDLHDVFEIDAVSSSVAISSDVTNPDYDLVFGRISYGKGNCLIRMIESFIGTPAFRAGINQVTMNRILYNCVY